MSMKKLLTNALRGEKELLTGYENALLTGKFDRPGERKSLLDAKTKCRQRVNELETALLATQSNDAANDDDVPVSPGRAQSARVPATADQQPSFSALEPPADSRKQARPKSARIMDRVSGLFSTATTTSDAGGAGGGGGGGGTATPGGAGVAAGTALNVKKEGQLEKATTGMFRSKVHWVSKWCVLTVSGFFLLGKLDSNQEFSQSKKVPVSRATVERLIDVDGGGRRRRFAIAQPDGGGTVFLQAANEEDALAWLAALQDVGASLLVSDDARSSSTATTTAPTATATRIDPSQLSPRALSPDIEHPSSDADGDADADQSASTSSGPAAVTSAMNPNYLVLDRKFMKNLRETNGDPASAESSETGPGAAAPLGGVYGSIRHGGGAKELQKSGGMYGPINHLQQNASEQPTPAAPTAAATGGMYGPIKQQEKAAAAQPTSTSAAVVSAMLQEADGFYSPLPLKPAGSSNAVELEVNATGPDDNDNNGDSLPPLTRGTLVIDPDWAQQSTGPADAVDNDVKSTDAPAADDAGGVPDADAPPVAAPAAAVVAGRNSYMVLPDSVFKPGGGPPKPVPKTPAAAADQYSSVPANTQKPHSSTPITVSATFNPFQCTVCGRSYLTSADLDMHTKSRHAETQATPSGYGQRPTGPMPTAGSTTNTTKKKQQPPLPPKPKEVHL